MSNCLLVWVVVCDVVDVDVVVVVVCCVFDEGFWVCFVLVECKCVLLCLVELMLVYCEELVLFDLLNMGKLVMDVWNIDVFGVVYVFVWYVESFDKFYD